MNVDIVRSEFWYLKRKVNYTWQVVVILADHRCQFFVYEWLIYFGPLMPAVHLEPSASLHIICKAYQQANLACQPALWQKFCSLLLCFPIWLYFLAHLLLPKWLLDGSVLFVAFGSIYHQLWTFPLYPYHAICYDLYLFIPGNNNSAQLSSGLQVHCTGLYQSIHLIWSPDPAAYQGPKIQELGRGLERQPRKPQLWVERQC